MSTSFNVTFPNRDIADLAMSSLRKADIGFRVDGMPAFTASMQLPIAPKYCANLYYPFPPARFLSGGLDQAHASYGSRAILNVDTTGAPLVETGSLKTTVTVAEDDADSARNILRNQGGYDFGIIP